MEELELELSNAERHRRRKAEEITRQQENYQAELEVCRALEHDVCIALMLPWSHELSV
eukprot:SAG31_NODE_12671_length_925_cov_1.553269_2_plen_58_part_00